MVGAWALGGSHHTPPAAIEGPYVSQGATGRVTSSGLGPAWRTVPHMQHQTPWAVGVGNLVSEDVAGTFLNHCNGYGA